MYFDSYWSKGKIPPTYGYSRDNELEIIIAVSGIIIRKDFRDVNQKKAFLNKYFGKCFDFKCIAYGSGKIQTAMVT